MKRREFIAGLGGTAAWPLAARAQQGERVRRIGILWRLRENDPLQQKWRAAFWQGLAKLGWVEGRNLTVVNRWDPKTDEEARTFAKELVDFYPDILSTGTPRLVWALQQQTKTIPIVFIGAGDQTSSFGAALVAGCGRSAARSSGAAAIQTSAQSLFGPQVCSRGAFGEQRENILRPLGHVTARHFIVPTFPH
jgi:putative tryptophan/tyrosine transport system substrate-binding protein